MIKVDTAILSEEANRLQKTATDMTEIAATVRKIAAHLEVEDSVFEREVETILFTATKIRKESEMIWSLAETCQQSCVFYENTERRLSDLSIGKHVELPQLSKGFRPVHPNIFPTVMWWLPHCRPDIHNIIRNYWLDHWLYVQLFSDPRWKNWWQWYHYLAPRPKIPKIKRFLFYRIIPKRNLYVQIHSVLGNLLK